MWKIVQYTVQCKVVPTPLIECALNLSQIRVHFDELLFKKSGIISSNSNFKIKD